jgi:hypothetical protein
MGSARAPLSEASVRRYNRPTTHPPVHPELEFNFAICLLPIEEVVLADAKHPRDHFLRARCVSTTLDPDTMRIDGRERPRSAGAAPSIFTLTHCVCAAAKWKAAMCIHTCIIIAGVI